jgi:leader peptidase (prepilin peptidase)/N-methyltransferase
VSLQNAWHLAALALAGLLAAPLIDRWARTLHGEPAVWGPRGAGARRQAVTVLLPLLGVGAGLLYGPTPRAAVAAFYAALFLLIALIDLEQELIPDRLVVAGLLTAPITATLWGISPLGIALGAAVEFGFFLGSAVLFRGAVKEGDVKLAAYLGAITGFPRAMYGMFMMSLTAGAVSLLLIALRRKRMGDLIPFAPFMVAGTALALLTGR